MENLMIAVQAFPRTLGIRTRGVLSLKIGRGVLSKPISATTVLNWANLPFPFTFLTYSEGQNQMKFAHEQNILQGSFVQALKRDTSFKKVGLIFV